MSVSLRPSRRSGSRSPLTAENTQRTLDSLGAAGDALRTRGRDARGQVGHLIEQVEQRATPAAEQALGALKPRVEQAGDVLQNSVLPEVRDRWATAASQVAGAARQAGEAMSPGVSSLLDELADRTGPQAHEAKRRAASAAAALRGTPAPRRRKRKAAALLTLGAALGFVGGLLARRDASSTTPPGAFAAPPTPIPVPGATGPAGTAGTADKEEQPAEAQH